MSFSSDSTSLRTVANFPTSFRPPTSRSGVGATRFFRPAALGFLAAGAVLLALAAPAGAAIHTYENTVGGTIPDAGSDALCDSSGLAVSFVVPAADNFTVTSVAVGLNISHPDRDDIQARLYHPNGTTFDTVLSQVGGSFADFDILITPDSEAAYDDGDADPVGEPRYFRLVDRNDLAGDFDNLAANGTWTLRVCDRVTGEGETKTVNRALLVLTDSTAAATQRCSSVSTLNWGSFNDRTDFSSSSPVPGGVLVTETESADFGGNGDNSLGGPGNFVTRTDELGNEMGYYSLYMDADGTNGNAPGDDSETVGERVTFTFSVPTSTLSFTVSDIDWYNTQTLRDFEDQVRVIGLGPDLTARVPYVVTGIGDRIDVEGDVLEGNDGDSANDETRGSATITFNGPVSRVSIEYSQGDEPAISADDQRIGIGDLSFCAFDYGDAPNSYGTVARQAMGSNALHLGPRAGDGETAQQSGNSASTDDGNNPGGGGLDDEDGVPIPFPAMTAGPGGTYTIPNIVVRNTTGAQATLCGWFDFDINGQAAPGDGTFQANEGTCITIPASGNLGTCVESPAGTFSCSLSWIVPADFVRVGGQNYYSRFRVAPAAAGLNTGHFNSNPTILGVEQPGEVEDYVFAAGTLPVTIAWVDAAPTAGGISLHFATATETANAGFRIWGTNAQGKRLLLANLKSHVTDSFLPQQYEATVAGAAGSAITAIEIEDMSIVGDNRLHGPFAVGLTFGAEPEADAVDWEAVRSESGVITALDRMRAARAADAPAEEFAIESFRATTTASARGLLLVRDEGIHRVTYEQLRSAGIDLAGAPAARIALVDNGVGIPRYVEAPGGVFGPGGYIEFVARPQLTLASPVDALILTLNPHKAVAVASVNPGRGGSGVTAAKDRYRPERIYSFSSPNGDPWYDVRVLAWGAPATISRSFDLPNLAAGAVQLTVRLWGNGDFTGSAPDHHVILKLNGVEVAQRTFDGIIPWEPEIDVTGLATASGNTLEVLVSGDTGYDFDNIAFEGFEVAYSRATVARSERFQGTAPQMLAFTIGGFAAGEPVAVWKVSGNTLKRDLRQPARGTVVAAGGPGDVYAASQSALYSPGIVPGVPAAQLRSTAEYLIVTHPSLADATADLVALEESRGFTTEVVTTDRIFAAYSDHASSAAALKSFLSASLAQGQLRYVLLVGADTSDPYDHLGLGSISFVPTDYRNFSEVVRYSPTDESLVDRQNDGLGDVPIGRLPVRTPAELEAVVAKLYDWESAITSARPSALLAAGLSDGDRAIASVNEAYAASLPGWNTVLAQVDDSSTAAVRQQVLDGINAGAHLVSYVGHSSMGQWDITPILKWQDVATLTNAGLPNLFTAWGCWNSYYVEPTIESLSARLLRQADAGAAGAIGATTLTTEASHRLLGTLFFARVNAGASTVGEAFHGAKQDLATQGGGIGAMDAIYGMTLLGDPAMSLPHLD